MLGASTSTAAMRELSWKNTRLVITPPGIQHRALLAMLLLLLELSRALCDMLGIRQLLGLP